MEEYTYFDEYQHRKFILAELKEAEKEALDPNTKWYTSEDVHTEILS
ncbi:MAG: hypothetical protein FWC89_00295 [Defluviitaleaceae bacterium]|nr:hypothetical protein [Defluviitaleaceae bacterium]